MVVSSLDNRVDIPALLANTRRRGEAHESTVTLKTNDGRQTAARLCWLWLPKPEAEKARARAMRDGAKADEELDSSEYIVLLTTAPQMRLRVDQIFELYRARWQIELNFKRDKSIGQLDRLPSMTPATKVTIRTAANAASEVLFASPIPSRVELPLMKETKKPPVSRKPTAST